MTRTFVMTALAIVAGLILIATPAMAVHKGSGGLACGSCHTMHNSQGGATLGGTPTAILLRGTGTTSDFCLSCHADTGVASNNDIVYNALLAATTPPSVYLETAPFALGATDFSLVGAGGDFSGTGLWNGITFVADGAASIDTGHSLNAAGTPPGATVPAVMPSLQCTNCHDPHGTNVTTASVNVYRNLRANIAEQGNAVGDWTTLGNTLEFITDLGDSYTGGVNAGDNSAPTGNALGGNIWPVYQGLNNNVYSTSFSYFCTQCHGAWHEDQNNDGIVDNNASGVDWTRHPVGTQLTGDGTATSSSGNTIIDLTNYATWGAGTGNLPVATGSGVAGGTGAYDQTAPATDEVFCLSCHFAHGGPNSDGLRWDYTTAVVSGNQTGLAMAVGQGCNACHNK
ncbi:MAG: hypothetical protein KAT46_05025 [Deltaproteobacteria bacterium]|nr:hypothetical protein [Deltaproteobacteria bacterium]